SSAAACLYVNPSASLLSTSSFFFYSSAPHRHLHSFPTRRSSDLTTSRPRISSTTPPSPSSSRCPRPAPSPSARRSPGTRRSLTRSEEHTSELQSPYDLVCRLLLEKKKTIK